MSDSDCHARWARRPRTRGRVRRRCPLRGFSLVELLTSVAIAAVLAALLLPALQAAREAARRSTCQQRLRQIGVALHVYHDQHRHFPVGCIEWRPPGAGRGERQLAWSASLLPHLEQQHLHARIDFGRPFDDPRNQPAAEQPLVAYRCPSSHRQPTDAAARGASDYGGIFGERITGLNHPPQGAMVHDDAIALRHIADGASRTLIVGEDSHHPDGEWINGRNLFDQAFAINAGPPVENDLRSDHPGGVQTLRADGSAGFLADATQLDVLAALCTRAGGEL
jgi:prepilin-type N-terminal cleavage/methylation domain-containing protein